MVESDARTAKPKLTLDLPHPDTLLVARTEDMPVDPQCHSFELRLQDLFLVLFQDKHLDTFALSPKFNLAIVLSSEHPVLTPSIMPLEPHSIPRELECVQNYESYSSHWLSPEY